MFDFLFKTALALALGGLVGLERERSKHPLVGTRTFALTCFLAFLLTFFSSDLLLPLLGLAGVFALSVVYYYFKALRKGRAGLTTALMIPFTYLLGMFVGMNHYFEAGVAAIAATFLLAEKKQVHALASKVSKEEFVDLLLFAVIAFIIYPVLPAEPIDVLGFAFNLQYFWTIVVLISGLSFAAHVLLKFVKEKAVFYSSLLGGFISSVALVTVFAKKTRDARILRRVVLYSSVGSFASNALIVLIISPLLFGQVLPLLALFLAALLGLSWFYSLRAPESMLTPGRKPLSLTFLFEFAAVFFAITLFVDWASAQGSLGLLLSSAIGGLISSTSVFASVTYLFLSSEITLSAAVPAFLLSLLASFAVKVFVALPRMPAREWPALFKPFAVLAAASGLGAFLAFL